MKFMQKRRSYVSLCYVKGWVYKISHHTFTKTSTKINSDQIKSITEMNGHCNENQHKHR